jgi:hypothetical protein
MHKSETDVGVPYHGATSSGRRRNRLSLLGDQIYFVPSKHYSDQELLLFDLRRYLKVILALQAVFVITILVCFGAVWSQLKQYDILKPQSMNSLNSNIQAITTNAASMTTLAVPIVSNMQFATNALTAAIAGNMNLTEVNTTSAVARADAGSSASRHMLAFTDEAPPEVVTSNDLALQDFRFRKMVYKHVTHLLNTTSAKMADFNPGAVSDLLTFIVSGVNYTSVNDNFKRVMDDVEKTAHFGVLASSMLGIAATATNTTLPSPGDLMKMYSQQKAAASTNAGSCM